MSTPLAIKGRVVHGEFALELDATLDLDDTLAVFGPSGSGKTTLLRLIAGLVRSEHCEISFGSTIWQDARRFVPAHRRRIGYVFQDGRLFAHMNVERNLEYGTRFAVRHDMIALDDVVDALALGPLLGRKVQTLSGGEAQRVAVGRALLSNPELLLMDEPLSSLDLARRREIVDYIAELPRRFGIPIVYVTHDVDEVARLAHKTALLSAGRLVAYGATIDVFAATEGFDLYGREEASSIVRGTVDSHHGPLTVVRVGRERLKIPNIHASVGASCQIRIRAKDVVIATRPLDGVSIRNSLTCTLSDIRERDPLHAELLLDADGQTLRALVTRDAATELGLRPGTTVYALIKSIAFEAML